MLLFSSFFLYRYLAPPDLLSFPTRRSSDLARYPKHPDGVPPEPDATVSDYRQIMNWLGIERVVDRKSTRLNSSHLVSSYAVFCLKKKRRRPEMNAGCERAMQLTPRR